MLLALGAGQQCNLLKHVHKIKTAFIQESTWKTMLCSITLLTVFLCRISLTEHIGPHSG